MEKKYCFLKGKLIKEWLKKKGNPHYNLIVTSENQDFNVNINVRSRVAPHQLKYYYFTEKDNLNNSIIDRCFQLNTGIHTDLITGNEGYCLDYLRANIFDINFVDILPVVPEEQITDLEILFEKNLKMVLNNPNYDIGVWGMAYFNKNKQIIGIHDVHMNQGNHKNFANENGIWQDGGIAVLDGKNNKISFAIFFMFQSQCINTDSQGNCH